MTRCGPVDSDQFAQHHRRQGHHFEALARDRGDPLERFARQPADDLEEDLRFGASDRVMVDDVERVVRMIHVQPGQCARRAADQVQVLPDPPARDRRSGERPLDRFRDRLGVVANLGQTQRS